MRKGNRGVSRLFLMTILPILVAAEQQPQLGAQEMKTLLHPLHFAMSQIFAKGFLIIQGVNSDVEIRHLKGEVT